MQPSSVTVLTTATPRSHISWSLIQREASRGVTHHLAQMVLACGPCFTTCENESLCLRSIMGPENSWPGGKKQWLDQLLPEQRQEQENTV